MAKPAVRVDVKGLRELQTGSRRLFKGIDDQARGDFKTVADQLAAMVRAKVPHRTGRLAGSVDAEQTAHGASAGYDVIYAGPVDFGGYPGLRPYVPQGRYLYPTAEAFEDQFERAGETAARNEIRGFIWPRPGPF